MNALGHKLITSTESPFLSGHQKIEGGKAKNVLLAFTSINRDNIAPLFASLTLPKNHHECCRAHTKSHEQRRYAHYKGAIYEARAEQLKAEFMHLFSQVSELSKLHIVDNILKLGLSSLFNKEIKDVLDGSNSNLNSPAAFEDDDVRSTALSFRLLRQHGYNVSLDLFLDAIDKMGSLKEGVGSNHRGALELFEASHLAVYGEEIMVKAKAFSRQHLIDSREDMDVNLAKQVADALEFPRHCRVTWFDVRHQIHAYEMEDDRNSILLELAKLNFNICQALLLQDLKEVSRWWKNLGLIENISFTRDRLVESFFWSVGVGPEPEHALFRKCLTKVVTFVLVIDDIYDIYGSLEELECFTRAVEEWDHEQVQQLPDCMKICFQALQKTTDEIANDIQDEYGWDDISCYLRTAWADFCKGLMVEAWWYYKSVIPSLEDYLRSAWITSSGPLMSLIALLCTANCKPEELRDKWGESQDLVYYTSLIIRLWNDLGTSAIELERGDASSSILCYMAEANVTDEMAKEHIKKIIGVAWTHVNAELASGSLEKKTFVNHVINLARLSHFMYRNGDGFGAPDEDIQGQIKRLLIEPLEYAYVANQ